MTLLAELVRQGPDHRLDALAQPTREHRGAGPAAAGRAEEHMAQSGGGPLDPGPGQAFVPHDRAR
uniref:hypothetical protein n=1 Tax=Marinitenerispora sediminis TaxID=1931232 RepID=UPI001C69A579